MQSNRQIIKRRLVEHYDEFATDYHRHNYGGEIRYSPLQWRQRYIENMIEDQGLPAGAQILDVGCGPGELVVNLTRRGYTVSGIDISTEMITSARALITQSGLPGADRLAVGDIEQLAFEQERFDAVIASGVIEYQKDDRAALSEMRRVLRSGGYLIVNVTSRYAYLNWLDGPYRMFKRYGPTRKLMAFLKERILRRGPLHDFPHRRTHSLAVFDRTLAEYGFRKVKHNVFHFSPLPTPLDSLLPVLHTLGARMERLTRHPLGRLLGGGYIVLAQKNGS